MNEVKPMNDYQHNFTEFVKANSHEIIPKSKEISVEDEFKATIKGLLLKNKILTTENMKLKIQVRQMNDIKLIKKQCLIDEDKIRIQRLKYDDFFERIDVFTKTPCGKVLYFPI